MTDDVFEELLASTARANLAATDIMIIACSHLQSSNKELAADLCSTLRSLLDSKLEITQEFRSICSKLIPVLDGNLDMPLNSISSPPKKLSPAELRENLSVVPRKK